MARKVIQATPHADIGARLKAARLSLGHDHLGDYAENAGIKPNAYSQNETGVKRIEVDAALSLKRKYGVTLDWIYAGDESSLPYKFVNGMARLRKQK